MRRWMTAVRAGAAGMAVGDLAYPDIVGHPRLRQVLAEYLARVRGAQAEPADLVITSGATDAIGLLCRDARDAGSRGGGGRGSQLAPAAGRVDGIRARRRSHPGR